MQESDYYDSLSGRKNYARVAAVVIFLFVSGLLVLQTFKSPHLDLTSHFYYDLNPEVRQRMSLYDWTVLREVRISFVSNFSGMVTLRAENGEILMMSFVEPGVETDLQFRVPDELTTLFIEHRDGVEAVDVSEHEVSALVF